MTINREAVIWGYRLFLDREPEAEKVIAEKVSLVSGSQELRRAFMQSEEFRANNQVSRLVALSGSEPAMHIEVLQEDGSLEALFTHIQRTWQRLGETDPFWSVVASEAYREGKLQCPGVTDAFYDSGRNDVAQIFNSLKRNRIDHTTLKTCLEYGCGLGRVTRWLAEKFDTAYGYDISQAHIGLAQSYLTGKNVPNVILKHIKNAEDLTHLAKVDLIYSVMVLQHNPPPMIAFIIRNLIRALNPGGIGFFQLPTYRLDYRFSFKDYLLNSAVKEEMEMHVLPQREIFQIIAQEGAIPVEIIEDSYTGLRFKELSNTFVIQKIKAMT